jgi:hypothetical protein
MHELEGKLEGLSGLLSMWGNETFGHVRKELKEPKGALVDLRAQPDRLGPIHRELKVVERINELQRREETMWRQRSRIQWLAEGDRNTRFFHLRASKRKKRNRISRLRRADGNFTKDQQELSQLVMSHRTSWETPRGRYDEHINKFSPSYDTKV